MQNYYDELNPAPRLLMGPGPVDVDPRVLKAMSMPLLGQFDPQFTQYMNETMDLYRGVFRTQNHWTFLVDGTARAGIEALLCSVIIPGDKVLIPVLGRFGLLLAEIAGRCGARVITIETAWGTVFTPAQVEAALKTHRPKLVTLVQGDTSTTMAQPLEELGSLCRRYDALFYVDATASIAGMELQTDEWQIDAVSAGLQKCLSGPPGIAPITFNERIEELVLARKQIERGIRTDADRPGGGPVIQSNYLDLAMLMDYWSEKRLNHHTESTSLVYAARECARIALLEGYPARFARHALASRALTAGLEAMGLEIFGDRRHKMPNVTGVQIPAGVPGEPVRAALLENFGIEIGTSFGPLHGKIWRIGTMGYACTKRNILLCLAGLEATLRQAGYQARWGAAVDAALGIYA